MTDPSTTFQPRKPIQYRPRVANAPADPQAAATPAPATPATAAAPPALKLAGTPAEPKKPAADGRQ
jgi:hypothetical protein